MRAALIDLDDTLIDRDAAVRAWLARAALPVPELLPDDLAAVWGEPLAARMREELPALIQPDPRVLTALDRLAHAGWSLALLSNGGARTQRAKLAAAGIASDRFVSVLISEELGLAKPDRRMFEAGLRTLACTPAEAIMIGDAPTHDMLGAAAVGVSGCWITRGRSWTGPGSRPALSAFDFPAAVAALLDPVPDKTR
jgi:putative hydrolase of the HAD superfamily